MENTKQPGIARRAAVGMGKAWAYSLGFTGLARELGRIGGNVIAAGGYVRRRLKDGPQNYRVETFDDAVDRLGLSETHLIRQARAFRLYAIWYFIATMLATLWMAYAPFTDHPLNALLMSIGAVVLTGAKWLKFHFRYCQIRDRELFAFGPWVCNPGRW